MAIERLLIATSVFVGIGLSASMLAIASGEISDHRERVSMRGLGTVEGTVFYRNDRRHAWRLARYYVKTPKTGELAEAVVALAAPSLGSAGGGHQRALVTVDQKEMRFVPETIAIRVGDRVRFTNSDPQTHNISLTDPRLQFSDTIATGQTAVEPFTRPSGIRRPFALSCKFHSPMQGWIYVFDHPFFQMTQVNGRFRLENVPPGDYRLDVAQPAGELHASRPVQVKADHATKIEIILTPADRSEAQ
jgi:plastocyanin